MFQYLWDDQIYVGVMAQDLVASCPEALTVDKWGYYRVNYETLGLRMLTLREYQNMHKSIYDSIEY